MDPRCPHCGPLSLGHDCDYVNKRNKLIPTAERNATRIVGPLLSSSHRENREWHARWDRAFMSEMDRLWSLELGKQHDFRRRARVELDALRKRWRARGVSRAEAAAALRDASDEHSYTH